MRTLVIHVGGIGDFLLCCPALIRLAEEGPIEILGQPGRTRLAVTTGIAAAVHDIDRVGFESVFGEPSTRLAGFLASFDRAIIWMRDAGEIRNGFRKCGIRDVRTFPGIPRETRASHASNYYLECLGYGSAPPLRLAIASGGNCSDLFIHPGSGGRRKNWPLDRFERLSEALKSKGRTVIWCKGPAEKGLRFPAGAEQSSGPWPDLVKVKRYQPAAVSVLHDLQ